MELIIFIGIQATGKSSFYKDRFYRTHVRLNYDMLKTRYREKSLFAACIESKVKLVVDNTNLTREDRARYITPAKPAGFSVIGYFFESRIADALRRNSTRSIKEQVPEKGLLGSSRRLELPTQEEGFDRLFFVKLEEPKNFFVEDWKHEI